MPSRSLEIDWDNLSASVSSIERSRQEAKRLREAISQSIGVPVAPKPARKKHVKKPPFVKKNELIYDGSRVPFTNLHKLLADSRLTNARGARKNLDKVQYVSIRLLPNGTAEAKFATEYSYTYGISIFPDMDVLKAWLKKYPPLRGKKLRVDGNPAGTIVRYNARLNLSKERPALTRTIEEHRAARTAAIERERLKEEAKAAAAKEAKDSAPKKPRKSRAKKAEVAVAAVDLPGRRYVARSARIAAMENN